MNHIPIIEPASARVLATNFQLTINDVNEDGTEYRRPLTTIQERTVLLVFKDRSGEQTLIPLGAVNAARIGHELIREANDAANAVDADDLDTTEAEVTITRNGGGDNES